MTLTINFASQPNCFTTTIGKGLMMLDVTPTERWEEILGQKALVLAGIEVNTACELGKFTYEDDALDVGWVNRVFYV